MICGQIPRECCLNEALSGRRLLVRNLARARSRRPRGALVYDQLPPLLEQARASCQRSGRQRAEEVLPAPWLGDRQGQEPAPVRGLQRSQQEEASAAGAGRRGDPAAATAQPTRSRLGGGDRGAAQYFLAAPSLGDGPATGRRSVRGRLGWRRARYIAFANAV